MKSSSMETYFFINPCSGRYDRARIDTAVARLDEAGLSPIVCSITTPAIFKTINSSAKPPLVVVAAGDGTVNAVINGLNPQAATLAILPLGTSNVLAAEIGITSLADGIRRIIAGKTQALSVGVIELEGFSRRFVLMAGIGFDGAVVRDVWLPGKRLLKQGGYAIAALLNCLRWDPGRVEISTSDQKTACHSVIICNAARYGGRFTLAPECSLFSPGLSAVCVQKNSRRTYLRLVLELFSGQLATSRSLIRIPAAECAIRGRKPVQIDGDFIGYSPAHVRSLADFARIVV